MLPYNQKATFNSVHINPKFKNAHINPSFFSIIDRQPQTIASNIHVNPKFLNSSSCNPYSQQQLSSQFQVKNVAIAESIPELCLKSPIYKTARKIIRHIDTSNGPNNLTKSLGSPTTRMVKIGKNKLIRASQINPPPIQPSFITPKLQKQSARLKRLALDKSKYKIDRRKDLTKKTPHKTRKLVSRYCLKRVSLNENLTPKRVTITNRKLMRIGTSFVNHSPQQLHKLPVALTSKNPIKLSANKKLHFLNINGVLYKSTKTTLQKSLPNVQTKNISPSQQLSAQSKNNQTRMLFIRGEKFTLDSNGKRLQKLNSDSMIKMQRIDIGRLTYIAKPNGTYERTNTHYARTHLNHAKQKSIHILSNNLVKSNMPCLIYRRLGKCLAKERGRCPKVHDPNQVAVCKKFLKGSCHDEKCLLSHKVSLSKMPTCKFFLQGRCYKNDCQYLHKKVNEKTEICLDFIKGFCSLADKCHKRHDNLCPDLVSKGKCEKLRCPYPHPNPHKNPDIKRKHTPPNIIAEQPMIDNDQKSDHNRYYSEHTSSNDAIKMEISSENQLSEHGKVQLTRALNKIEKMKANLKLYDLRNDGQSQNSIISNNKFLITDEVNSLNDEIQVVVPKRPKLGQLPSYIPIE